ncbi:MAG: leucine-rich repeat protein [Treponema sp.]|jgi:hypothetical protein|nr:leucine-rich repeat protein [Treponema sp.]
MKNFFRCLGIAAVIMVIGFLITCSNDTPGSVKDQTTATADLQGTITITPNSGVVTGTELTAVYSGSEPVAYQWEKDGNNVGANSNKYTPTVTGSYTVTVSAKGYNPKISEAVNVGEPSLFTLQGTIAITPNSGVQINTELIATYSGSEQIAYQWKKDGNNVGANSNKYKPATAGSYTVTVSAEGYNPKTSAVVDVSDPSLSTLQGTVNITPNSGVITGTELTAVYSGSEPVAYQWKKDGNNVGVNSNKYKPATAGSYTVTVSASNYNPKTSAAVNVTVPTFNAATAFKTWLDAQPANTAVTPYTVVLNVGSLSGDASIPGSVGAALLANNSKYVSLDISSSTFTSIEFYAFQNCTNLSGVTLPDSVNSIGRDAFQGTAWLDNQPNGLVYAGKVALTYKGTMPANTNIILSNGTKGIADTAFSSCSNLTGITIPNSVTNIGNSAFIHCTGLVSINIPNSVTSIGNNVFLGCNSLTGTLVIPNSVTNIGDAAFNNCTGIVSVILPANAGFTSIGKSVFFKCGITSVTIPNNVTSIREDAFYNCSNLASVTIPGSVISIEDSAFMDCNNLTSVMFQGAIPSSGFSAATGISAPFLGDLRTKFYTSNTTNGTPGTYKTTAPVSANSTWTKQP